MADLVWGNFIGLPD